MCRKWSQWSIGTSSSTKLLTCAVVRSYSWVFRHGHSVLSVRFLVALAAMRAGLQRDLGRPHGRIVQSEKEQELVLFQMCPCKSVGDGSSVARGGTHMQRLSGLREKGIWSWCGWPLSTCVVCWFHSAGCGHTCWSWANGVWAKFQCAFHEAVEHACRSLLSVCFEIHDEKL